jgi:hypothetical protein
MIKSLSQRLSHIPRLEPGRIYTALLFLPLPQTTLQNAKADKSRKENTYITLNKNDLILTKDISDINNEYLISSLLKINKWYLDIDYRQNKQNEVILIYGIKLSTNEEFADIFANEDFNNIFKSLDNLR